ncbi:MAG: phosphate ABC transporter permease subunit PstC [Gemmatimonadota bacterium]
MNPPARSGAPPDPPPPQARPDFRRRRHPGERLIAAFLFLCATLSAAATLGIVVILTVESVIFFSRVSVVEFFTDTRWSPLFQDPHFGVLPLAAGSFLVAAGAAAVALPVGLLTAIFLSEYAGRRLRRILKPVLEILAGIPTVVYGYFALTFVTPLIRLVLPGTDVFNAASAAIVVGIMTIPTVASLSEDALQAVPEGLREGAFGLGATRFEVATRVVLPAAVSGVVASFILAVSRAIGETMIVTIAAGNIANLTLNPLESVQTMTAYIVSVSRGDTPRDSLAYQTLFAVGLTLFLITLAMNLVSQRVLTRARGERS